jgi:D-lactate dehydrogenase
MPYPDLLEKLREAVGAKNVFTGEKKTAYYRSGFRSGLGDALAVIFPETLLQQWHILQHCVESGCVIIMQGAKTGLTEGSCPSGSDYDRPVIIISSRRLTKLVLLDGGKQVLALPGASLHQLERLLRPLGRAPHSVIGSTSIGATIVGGIANNAGGALCKRGSSYTELSLFARVDANGKLQLVDHLGIRKLGKTPEQIFERIESGQIDSADLEAQDTPASDREYATRIRDLAADLPNRYNADPKRLFELSGSAGKVAAFAVRVDTYPLPKKEQVFFIGTDQPNELTKLRQQILTKFKELPEMCEYMNRDIFKVAEHYGKDVFLSIKHIGTRRIPMAFVFKSAIEHRLNKLKFLPRFLPDLLLYHLSRLFPQHLPSACWSIATVSITT